MKNIITILIPLLFLTSCGKSQSKRSFIKFTGIVEKDINNYFTDSAVIADIMDGIKQEPRQV
ncbi:MAG: hypothetical protein ACR2MX_15180, partial [Cyclobacteriaceae bacterium]